MNCKKCGKEMEEWTQLMCHYSACVNKKCLFEGLVRIVGLNESVEKSRKVDQMFKKAEEQRKAMEVAA